MPDAGRPINPDTAYEPKDTPPYLIFALMGLIAAVTIAVGLILSGIYSGTLQESSRGPGKTLLPPKPRLEVNEAAALRRFRARTEKRLESYGWVDRKNGIVHIPIMAALKQAAAAGFPDWPGNPKPAMANAAARNAPANRPGNASGKSPNLNYTIAPPLLPGPRAAAGGAARNRPPAPSGTPATTAAGAGAHGR